MGHLNNGFLWVPFTFETSLKSWITQKDEYQQ